jgi:hypothetical protein
VDVDSYYSDDSDSNESQDEGQEKYNFEMTLGKPDNPKVNNFPHFEAYNKETILEDLPELDNFDQRRVRADSNQIRKIDIDGRILKTIKLEIPGEGHIPSIALKSKKSEISSYSSVDNGSSSDEDSPRESPLHQIKEADEHEEENRASVVAVKRIVSYD